MPASLDLRKLASADGVEFGFVDARHRDHILIALDDRASAVSDGAHRQFGLERRSELARSTRSSGACSIAAIGAATGTPPRGRANTTTSSPL